MSRKRKSWFSISAITGWLYFIAFVAIVYFIFTQWSSCKRSEYSMKLEETPLSIGKIEAIAQLATLSYTEEFVIDSTEHYRNVSDRMSGGMDRIFAQGDVKNALKNSGIDRRLTIITKIRGEIGFDMKKIEQIVISKDSVLIKSPYPTLLQLSVDYRESEVFIEIGNWKDSERKKLEQKAIAKAKRRIEKENLKQKSIAKYEAIIQKTIPNRTCIYEYY